MWLLLKNVFVFIKVCNSTQFDCKSAGCTDPENENDYDPACQGNCIPKEWVNDGKNDCTDASDEGITGMIVSNFFENWTWQGSMSFFYSREEPTSNPAMFHTISTCGCKAIITLTNCNKDGSALFYDSRP